MWKATLFGVPLVLCSCGVIPVTASVRRHGASRAAATSFLLSTPQTGIDSIAITYALLGPVVAVFRPIIAFATGLLGGVLVWLFGEAEGTVRPTAALRRTAPRPAAPATAGEASSAGPWSTAFWSCPATLAGPCCWASSIAGVIGVLVPQNGWEAYLGGGILSIVAMMLLGVPLYVCASASVPIAAGLIHAGASPARRWPS